MYNSLKVAGAFAFSAFLLYFGFKYMLTNEQRSLFFSIPADTIVLSILLAIPGYLIGGIELRFLYNRIGKVTLSVYDTLSLPFVVNLWGFILPFQGSFIYTTAYVFAKYKRKVSDSVKVYLFSFSVSMCMAGAIGLAYSFFSFQPLSLLFQIVCIVLLLNPIPLYFLGGFLQKAESVNSGLMRWLIDKSRKYISSDRIDRSTLVTILLIKTGNIILGWGWLYWVAITFNIDLGVVQLVLILLLMNITTLIKLTPGNIGFNQLASGGLAVLVGGTVNDGFFLSAFQFLTNIIIAFLLGGAFSLLNLKYLNLKSIKSALTKSSSARS